MPTLLADPQPATSASAPAPAAVLRLIVRNHPGVMSHICGLFGRRAFNVDGIACLPLADAERSVVLLLVREDARLEQVMRQLAKLADVIEIQRQADGEAVFSVVATALGCATEADGART